MGREIFRELEKDHAEIGRTIVEGDVVPGVDGRNPYRNGRKRSVLVR